MTRTDDPAIDATAAASRLVSLADIEAAAARLQGVAMRTPLLTLGQRDEDPPGARAWIKPESLQPIGAFKIRGAYNALTQLSPSERAAGVVTHSSGNHAQGVSRAAKLLGIEATIVMPDDAPAVKVAGVLADGATIDVVGASNEERMERAEALAQQRGLTLIPAYDDDHIIAGQGTVGLEIVEQLAESGIEVDAPLTVLVPIGGGGLAAGVSIAVKQLRPHARVVGVEPELAADARDSLRAGHVVRWEPALAGRTIADGVRTSALGERPYRHLARYLDDVVVVSEDGIIEAMGFAARRARLVVEPSGALAIAAWRSVPGLAASGDVVMIVSGGNVDADAYRRLLAASTD